MNAFTATATDATRQTRPGVVVKVAEMESIQRLIGSVSAQIDGARALMLTSLREGEALAASGETLSIEQRTRIRRDQSYAARTSAEAATALFAKSGARGADQSGAVQRFWRDASTAALHATIDWDMVAEMYGTQALGLTTLGVFLCTSSRAIVLPPVLL